MKRTSTAKRVTLTIALLGAWGCGSGGTSQFKNGQGAAGASTGGGSSSGDGIIIGTSGSGTGTGTVILGADGGGGGIVALVRDFRFYDASDSTTDPDFENPPYTVDQNGNPEPAGQIDYGPWDDLEIVTDTLGSDGSPVYKNAGGVTLSTHGKASFDAWYHDVKGTNISVSVPLALTENGTGGYTYDSSVSGLAYGVTGQGGGSLGFFPIDDGTAYATAFGDQIPTNAQPPYSGMKHNYSFTVEIDTVFTYRGGETFEFTGDDDVFVYIGKKRVINLGGIHGPESAMVSVDSLGLTVGQSYPLNFFSAERHVTGSNIKFTTTLGLVGVSPPPR